MFNMMNTVSITNLKQNIASIINAVKTSGEPIVVMQRSEPAVVMLDPDHYKMLEKMLEEKEDLKAIEERKNEPRIEFEEYFKKRFKKSLA